MGVRRRQINGNGERLPWTGRIEHKNAVRIVPADRQWRIALGRLRHDLPVFSIQNIHVGTDKV